MRFHIDQKTLERYIGMAKRFTASNGAKPILGTVLFQAKDDSVTLSSTNLEVFYNVKIPKIVTEQPGDACVPVRPLTDIVLKMPSKSGIILIEKNGNHLKCSTDDGRSVAEIDCYASIDDFPIISTDKEKSCTLNSGLFCEIIKLSSSASDDYIQKATTTFDCNGSAIFSTDAKRIAIHKLPDEIDLSELENFHLPSASLNDSLPILMESDDITISTSSGIVTFESELSTISIRKIDTRMINWNKVVPANISCTATIETKDLSKSIKYVSEVVKNRGNCVSFKMLSGTCEVFAEEHDIGSAKDSLQMDMNFTERVVFSLNSKYVMDFLKLGSGKTKIGYSQNGFPVMLSFDNNPNFMYIVMPISN